MNETTTPHSDVYTLVTDLIIAQLQQGTIPWQKPWTNGGLPQNLLTHRPYRGINVWMLGSLEYAMNYFLTWKQLRSIGGSVKKGEKAHLVIFWKKIEKTDATEADGEKQKSKPVLRYYWVFNIDQCSGIPEHLIFPIAKAEQPLAVCEAIIQGMPQRPAIKHKSSKAFYEAVEDYINVPKIKSFTDSESYYATLFHELIHSTGHKDRLNRKELNEMAEFGSEPYSIEELTAEIGSCYLASHTGIVTTFPNSVAYIDGWLQKLQNDTHFIVYGSSQAQKAVDFILNVGKDEE